MKKALIALATMFALMIAAPVMALDDPGVPIATIDSPLEASALPGHDIAMPELTDTGPPAAAAIDGSHTEPDTDMPAAARLSGGEPDLVVATTTAERFPGSALASRVPDSVQPVENHRQRLNPDNALQ